MIGHAAKRSQTRARTLWWRARGRRAVDSAGPALRILFYHRIADDSDPLALACDRFDAQMALLEAQGYQVLDVVTALDRLYDGSLEQDVIALTFDDGYVDNALNALPVLERHGFQATVFVVTDMAAGRAIFAPGHGSSAPVLTWDEIRALDGRSALTFEPHTVSHPDLTHATDTASWKEIAESRAALEEALGREASALAYPGGFVGARELSYMGRAGIRYGITCEPGLTTTATDRRLIRRTQIDSTDRLDDFEAKLYGSHDSSLLGRRLYRRLKYGAGNPLRAYPTASSASLTAPAEPPVEPAFHPTPEPDPVRETVVSDFGAAETADASLARGSAVLFGTQVVANLGFFIAVLILARGLAPADRGTIAFITLSMLVIAKIARLGLPEASSLFAVRTPARAATLVTNLGLATLSLGAFLGWAFVLVLLAVDARPAGTHTDDLLLIALVAPVASLADSLVGFLVGAGHPRAGGLLNTIHPWLYAVGLLVLASTSDLHPTSAAVLWGVAMVVAGLLVLGVTGGLRGFGRPSVTAFREAYQFGVRAWIGSTLRFLNFRTDQILMGFITTEAALGVYAVAVNASEVLLLLPQATGLALMPLIAIADPSIHRERALRAFRILIALTVPAIVFAMFAGPLVIPLLFGDEYDPSVVPFLLLAPGAVGFTAIAVFSSAALAGDQPLRSSVGAALAFVCGVVLVLVLVPLYGAQGAGLAATLAFTVGGVAQVVAYRGHAHFALRDLVPGPADAADCVGGLRRIGRMLGTGKRPG